MDEANYAVTRKAFLGSNLLEEVKSYEQYQENCLVCVFLLAWLHQVHLRHWSAPGMDQKDMGVFGKLVDELWSIQDGLVWMNCPSNETAPLPVLMKEAMLAPAGGQLFEWRQLISRIMLQG